MNSLICLLIFDIRNELISTGTEDNGDVFLVDTSGTPNTTKILTNICNRINSNNDKNQTTEEKFKSLILSLATDDASNFKVRASI